MWDWELLKNGSGQHHYEILSQYGNEDFQYTRAISYGTEEDEFCLHNHSMYELVYSLSGDAVYLAEGIRYQMEPKSLLMINPTVPHKLFLCSNQPFERHILYVYYVGNASVMSGLIGQCQRTLGKKRIGSVYLDPEEASAMSVFFERMDQASRAKDDSIQALTPYFAQALVAELLIVMKECNPKRFSVGTSRTVDTLLLYLSQNFTQNLTLAEIADRFYLSKDYCNRIFHKATGMTVIQYIIYNRVLYAKQLLSEGLSAADAAKQAGFSDYSNFYRSYRKITGRMPSDDYQIAGDVLNNPSLMRPKG